VNKIIANAAPINSINQLFGDVDEERLHLLWKEGAIVLYRGLFRSTSDRTPVLAVFAQHPSSDILSRLANEMSLKDQLREPWAVQPLEIRRSLDSIALVTGDPGGELLAGFLGAPLEIGQFLSISVGIAVAVGKMHQHGLIHRDIKPAKIFVGGTDGSVRLTGFGVASRLSREKHAHESPESAAGTLAYMAPERTGRTNRSVDARSDLYSVGVTLYQMLTGSLPFSASDPMEWMHSQIARKPVAPSERLESIPAPVSAIVMKLLAKAPEERYQTAGGLERDLRRCLSDWEDKQCIDDFRLGQQDTPSLFLIPEKLYGREREIAALLAIFDRIVKGGAPELLLVSGYSGIGKSSVVHELHKALIPPRGLFAPGKFDQYQRYVPYATLVQAFQCLVRQLLTMSDGELAEWRKALEDALGMNSRLIIDLIPELRLVIGDQPAPPELPPQQAKVRFQLVFQRFISVFARAEHPLVLFLDDLQWIDVATLDLLVDIQTRSTLKHLLLIGAYRDNEVNSDHPLLQTVDAIRAAGGQVSTVTLAPLACAHVSQMISDALRCEPEAAAQLAQLVHDKTGGNPFFVNQFLSMLTEEGLLTFDHERLRWIWDIELIDTQHYTDNVADLMVERIARLPHPVQHALQQMACLGNHAEIDRIALVLGITPEMLETTLWPARRLELIERSAGTYRFSHDRIQEAAYSLMPATEQIAAHLRIGRLLAVHTPPEQREEAIFDIVNQLNRGATLIVSPSEREQLAELNLAAGTRAKASAAYFSALNYFATGMTLLPESAWTKCGELAFALTFHRAECEFLTKAFDEAEERLSALQHNATTIPHFSEIARLRGEIFVTLGLIDRAVEVGLDFLRHLGVQWTAHPATEDVQEEYQRLRARLGDRSIQSLQDLPRMSAPEASATMDILLQIGTSALPTDENLLCLAVCRMANLSLEYGNSDGSCAAYIWLGLVLGPYLGDYRSGYAFAKLGLELVEKRGVERFKARAYLLFGGHVIPWSQHLRTGRPLIRHSFEVAKEVGDVTFAGFSCCNLISNLLASGEQLRSVQQEAETGFEFVRELRYKFVIDLMIPQLQLIRMLRGLTPNFGSFEDDDFDRELFERELQPDLIACCWYWTRTLQARFFAGLFSSALEASSNARPLLWTSRACLEASDYHFYTALVRARLCDGANTLERAEHLKALTGHCRKLDEWAVSCPETFKCRAALAAAEVARVEGWVPEAMRLYEQAIQSAQDSVLVNIEALANELAAGFYRQQGFEKIARAYLQDARRAYLRWGADGKVRQLDENFAYLRETQQFPSASGTTTAAVENLDLSTVIKVSQAISGETVLDTLIDTIMRTAIEQAGAEMAVLLLAEGAEYRTVATAATSSQGVTVDLHDGSREDAVVPDAVIRYVARSGNSVVLDDASETNPFSTAPYFSGRNVRSLLCIALTNQTKLIGVLYLENSLAPCVFSRTRLAILKLIASQAAISLENARLYRDVEERESKIRRLVDADVIGIVIWDLDGRLLEANDAFLRMLQYERKDLEAGLRWFDMTPHDWQNVHIHSEAEELKTTGKMLAREKEYYRKDGSRVPVLIGAAVFERNPNQGVAYILDLTDLKRAEAEARKSEQRYREVETELAHANRISTMGYLTGSIAHEVNQPITATVINAQAALRGLLAPQPDLKDLRDVLESIVRDGNRAGNIIARIRDLIIKAPPSKGPMEINEPIREVIELARSEITKNSVSVRTKLAEGLPSVRGDRVQLQQVMLNLIFNAVEALATCDAARRDILISTRISEPGRVLVSVQDTGPGLSPAARDSAFEAFYTTKSGGLGMGLSICRSIIEGHGGQIWTSENSPHGAAFHFTLPATSEGGL
jgi:PAS domain S-box-containing protein